MIQQVMCRLFGRQIRFAIQYSPVTIKPGSPGMQFLRQFAAFIVLVLPATVLLPAGSMAQNSPETANPDASPDARAIMRYLQTLPLRTDKKLISGQFESWGRAVLPLSDPANNLAIVHEKTGRWVGLVGVEYHQGGVFPDAPNRLCTAFWRRGGLVQLYLIMRNPAAPDASNGGGHCNIDQVLDPTHPYHKFFFDEMDQIVAGLEELQKNGVVVFLNPFAEASGDWFWWGGQPPDKFKALYHATFDYLVKTKHLNNLLFIYEPSSSHRTAASYYPGDNYVDMIGISIFVSSDHELVPSDIPAYSALTKFNKPLAFSQWGPRRGADQVGKDEPPADNTKLLRGIRDYFPRVTWWMNWNMVYAISSPTNSNSNDRQLLEDPMVINLDDLNWKSARQ
jgi:mannan endo-1,4-beta-mannosidase